MKKIVIILYISFYGFKGNGQIFYFATNQSEVGEQFNKFFPKDLFLNDTALIERPCFLMLSFKINDSNKLENLIVEGYFRATTPFYIKKTLQTVIDSSKLAVLTKNTNFVVPLFFTIQSENTKSLSKNKHAKTESGIAFYKKVFMSAEYYAGAVTESIYFFADTPIIFEGRCKVLPPIELSNMPYRATTPINREAILKNVKNLKFKKS